MLSTKEKRLYNKIIITELGIHAKKWPWQLYLRNGDPIFNKFNSTWTKKQCFDIFHERNPFYYDFNWLMRLVEYIEIKYQVKFKFEIVKRGSSQHQIGIYDKNSRFVLNQEEPSLNEALFLACCKYLRTYSVYNRYVMKDERV